MPRIVDVFFSLQSKERIENRESESSTRARGGCRVRREARW